MFRQNEYAAAHTAVYALTEKGAALARSVAGAIGGSVFVPQRMVDSSPVVPEAGFERLMDCVAETFAQFDAHVFVTATGIAVRAIAPHIVRKDADPAVVVMDQAGEHVISLLSGHLGGANALATSLAALVGGIALQLRMLILPWAW